MTNEQYQKICEKFMASPGNKENVYMLMLGIDIDWNKVKKIMDNLYPWFWNDKGEIILIILVKNDIISKDKYILAIIRIWFCLAWHDNRYGFQNKWPRWPIKELSL